MTDAQRTETLKESKLAWWRNEDWLTVWPEFLIKASVVKKIQ